MERKNRFWTFVTSLIPGAGQMYQGHIKRGASIMLTFMLIAAVTVFTNIGEISFALPVIWFFAFFDAMNKSHMTRDELYSMEDKPIISADILNKIDTNGFFNKRGSVIIGVAVILIGVIMLYRTMIMPLLDFYLPQFYYIAMKFPTIIIGIVIILIGIKIMRGPSGSSK